ncbi:MAG: SDR family oxidoreductase [Pseudomonadota bacterium]|nr:SDR family oxidoreductase [Pseudomonadota bacterium]
MDTYRHALITGGGRRIGAAITTGLARDGFTVGIHYHTSSKAADTLCGQLQDEGANAYKLQADLTDFGAVDSLVDQAIKTGGPLTCLINNASVFERDDAKSVSRKTWDIHMDVNLWAPVRLSQAFASALHDDQSGNIVNIVDQRVVSVPPDFFSYTISKGAMWTMTQSLALAMAPRIRVNAIGPGPTLPSPRQTIEQFREQALRMPLGAGPTPEEISDGVRYILSAHSLTGQLITLDGGQHLGWDFPDQNAPRIE